MPFDAILFDPRTTNSSRVSVRVLGSSLEVVGARETFRVDPVKCELTAGGWDRASLQIVWPGEGGVWALSAKDPGAKDELARVPRFETSLAAAARAQATARQSGRFGLTLIAVITMLPALLLLGLFIFRDRIIDSVLERIPLSVDQDVGKMFEGRFLNSKEAVEENEATRAVQLIVDRLKRASPEKGLEFKVSVQRNREVNAFAAPGGLIVVHTGLISEAGSAEEVAGVLAHEMAHTAKRHSMRQMIYGAGLLPLMGLLVGRTDAAGLVRDVGQLSALKFSRAQEEDADRIGFDTLVAASISTEGLARFFDRLARSEGTPAAFLSTHPSSAGRAAALRERSSPSAAARAEPLPIDWSAVQASIR